MLQLFIHALLLAQGASLCWASLAWSITEQTIKGGSHLFG